jgi:hypothetical protein
MSKQLLRSYIYTPGAAGVGTIKIPGKWDLNQITLITNVTRNSIIYNFADATFTNTSVSFSRANDANFPQVLQTADGITTITLGYSTTGHLSADNLQIFVENPVTIVRPWEFGTDAFERMRVANPQSMLDADFEYGLQPTKWMQLELERGYPSLYEIPGTDTNLSNITTNASGGGAADIESLITVTTPTPHYFATGTVVTLKGLNTAITGWSRAEGSFLINAVPSPTTFNYYAKAKVGTSGGQSLYTSYAILRKGGFYTGADIGTATFVTAGSGAATTGTVTVTFATNHGLLPGGSILTTISSDNGSNNHTLCQGPFYILSVPSATTLTYAARDVGTITGTPTGRVYARPDAFFIHRPFDGGVSLGTGSPGHGHQAVRQSKKYIRYQSGKAVNYNTGALFSPNYDLKSITANGTTVGSTITVTTDDLDHGLQVGAVINLNGIVTTGYNGNYVVASIVDERVFTVIATQVLGDTRAYFQAPAVVSHVSWHGSTVRAGIYDDQNGMYWQYDGQQMSIGQRSSTFQTAGTVSATPDSSLVTGIDTRFNEQVAAGDRVVIRGMTHVVTAVAGTATMYVSPDYRGASAVSGAKLVKIKDILVPQSQWNMDRCDGSNGVFNTSGYNLLPNKMQMIGLQWTWYGAGFIEWILRGPDGRYITVHRIKNSNVNTEAYMRSGNMPVRYEIQNESARAAITGTDLSTIGTSMTLTDVTFFPSTGTVYVDNEMIGYTGKSASSGTAQLTGLSRAVSLSMFTGGTTRTFTGGTAATHSTGTGVILISQTATPTISHWGSAFLTDGGFDQDRGYIFNYQAPNIIAGPVKKTAFAIRLAPSVSNAIPGDLGVRELINRAQLLLQSIEITAGGSTSPNQAIIIEGVLNPSNYSTSTNNTTWNSLQGGPQGGNAYGTGQPSFAQIAPGNTMFFDNSATYITTVAAGAAAGASTIAVYTTATMQVGDAISTASGTIAGGTVIINCSSSATVQISQPLIGNLTANVGIAGFRNTYAQPGETIFSFISSPANKDALDLSALKEMTNTPLGGRGAYPNGPDVLAINVYVTTGTALSTNLVLRWGEAQA